MIQAVGTGSSISGIDIEATQPPTRPLVSAGDTDTSRVTETLPPESDSGSDSSTSSGQLSGQFGKYRIIRVLGQGAMGTVYLAEDPELERKVAIKTPTMNSEDDADIRDRFRREARAVAALHHANICPIYEVSEVDGTLYLSMAYVKGKPLTDATLPDQLLPVKSILMLVRKLAMALQVAHEAGVIHRDLKPDNVLINLQGEPQIMDFGLARRQDAEDTVLTKAGHLIGSPTYMSPEQAAGNPELMGPNCDIWSLGVILYELLTGQRPFSGENVLSVLKAISVDDPTPPSSLRDGLDQRLDELVLKALEKDIDKRYSSMREFASALADYLTGRSSIRGVPKAEPRQGPPSQSGLALLGGEAAIPMVAPPEEDDGDEYHLAESDGVVCAHCGGPLDEAGRCLRCEEEAVAAKEASASGVRVDVGTGSSSGSRQRAPRNQTWADWLGLETRREGELPIHFYLIAMLLVMLLAGGGVLLENPSLTAWWTGLPLTIIASAGLCGSYVWMRSQLEVGTMRMLGAPFIALFNMIRLKTSSTCRSPAVRFGKWCLVAVIFGGILLLLSLGG